MEDYTSAALHLPPNQSFQCREESNSNNDSNSITFICNLPSGKADLQFATRSPSCGALHENEPSAQSLQEEEEDEDECAVDPNFFDEGYSLAGATGFTIWTGTRLLIETLCWKSSNCSSSAEQHGDDVSTHNRLKEIQSCIVKARVIELGAGVGVVGTYLAACGGNVLITDLPTLVENAIDDNLQRNSMEDPIEESEMNLDAFPSWLGSKAYRIGKGFANSASLDWTIPIEDQLTFDQCKSIDFIIASDVVFLVSMLTALLDTVASIFALSSANNPSFILSFQRRDSQDGEDSESFTTVKRVISEVKKRGWSVDCLAWRPVTVLKERDGRVVKDMSEVFVFEIRP